LSSALTAAIARDPALDTAAFVRCWCANVFADPAFAAAVAAVYEDSAELFEHGWYGGPLDGGRAAIGGLYLPPLLWVWWMRPTAAPLIWAYLAAATPDVARCLAAGRVAVERLDAHVALLAALAPAGDARARHVAESVRYLRDCIVAAQAIRGVLLPAFAAARRGDRAGWHAAASGAMAARAMLRAHREQWDGRRDFPALELDEVERFLRRLEAGGEWVMARSMSLLVGYLLRSGASRRTLRSVGAAALLAALAGAVASRRGGIALAAGLVGIALAGRLREPALRRALPWLSRRYFLLPTIFFETGPAFTEWTG
jgi:hypothetical protein